MIQNLAMINVPHNNFNLFLLQLQNIIFLSNYIHFFFNRLSVFTFYRFQQSLQITLRLQMSAPLHYVSRTIK